MYDIIRTIYMNTAADGSEASRVSVLQQTLSQLRLTNIATLDACMNHFTRLIELTSADEDYVAALATSLAPCILRPAGRDLPHPRGEARLQTRPRPLRPQGSHLQRAEAHVDTGALQFRGQQ